MFFLNLAGLRAVSQPLSPLQPDSLSNSGCKEKPHCLPYSRSRQVAAVVALSPTSRPQVPLGKEGRSRILTGHSMPPSLGDKFQHSLGFTSIFTSNKLPLTPFSLLLSSLLCKKAGRSLIRR